MSNRPLITKGTLAFDLVLVAVFYGFIAYLLIPFTFPAPPWAVYAQAAFAALPLAGVFFLALEMFRVTLTDQLSRKDQREQKTS